MLAAALVALVGACAAPSEDIHLAPLFTHVSRAGGGRETEALAGALRWRRKTPTSPIGEWALRPLVSHVRGPGPEESTTRFLVPFGIHHSTPADTRSQLVPVYWYFRTAYEDGTERRRLFTLPGIYSGRLPDGRRSFAWFPFGGRIREFLTWDVLDFALFPLFARTRREQRNSWHVLWPFFNSGESLGGGHTFRILPFYAESIRPGVYERRSIGWPFFHSSVQGLDGPPEARTSQWLLLPFLGRTTRDSYSATTVAWPFFGYASDWRTGYWAWDGPWPLVRFQGGGAELENDPEATIRRRFWPFWSHFRSDGLESTYYLWPFVNLRSESYSDGSRQAQFVIPFWQSWDRLDAQGQPLRRWRKLWPFYQDFATDRASQGYPDQRRFAFPALNPLWPTPVLDDHYAWLYELFTVETAYGGKSQRDLRSERSWGGIWRREVDSAEDRAYLSGLWSRRRAHDETGPLTETSLLFGLLRWRSRPDDSFDLMQPAFPGPGWPAHRAQPMSQQR